MTLNVTTLKTVVVNVILDTKSGFVLNSTANIVVTAADGIAAIKIKTLFNKSDTGNNVARNKANSGDIISRMTDAVATFATSKLLSDILANCIPKTTIIRGTVTTDRKSIIL